MLPAWQWREDRYADNPSRGPGHSATAEGNLTLWVQRRTRCVLSCGGGAGEKMAIRSPVIDPHPLLWAFVT